MTLFETPSNFFRLLPLDRKVELLSVIKLDVLPILGDRVQLQQVILNPVVNGIDAIEGHAERMSAPSASGLRGVENFAVLSVSDRGPGIPGDKLKGIFEPFYTQQGRRHGHGTVHRAHHYRGAPWADIGPKSGSRRRVVPDQTSSFDGSYGAGLNDQNSMKVTPLANQLATGAVQVHDATLFCRDLFALSSGVWHIAAFAALRTWSLWAA